MSAPSSSFLNSEDEVLKLARAHLLAAIDESAQGLHSIQRRISPIELVKHHPVAAAGIAVAVGVFAMRRQRIVQIPEARPCSWWKKALGMGLNFLFKKLLAVGLQRISLAQTLRALITTNRK
jgi:hypothetical protein